MPKLRYTTDVMAVLQIFLFESFVGFCLYITWKMKTPALKIDESGVVYYGTRLITDWNDVLSYKLSVHNDRVEFVSLKYVTIKFYLKEPHSQFLTWDVRLINFFQSKTKPQLIRIDVYGDVYGKAFEVITAIDSYLLIVKPQTIF